LWWIFAGTLGRNLGQRPGFPVWHRWEGLARGWIGYEFGHGHRLPHFSDARTLVRIGFDIGFDIAVDPKLARGSRVARDTPGSRQYSRGDRAQDWITSFERLVLRRFVF
jgi:hypothetical protein